MRNVFKRTLRARNVDPAGVLVVVYRGIWWIDRLTAPFFYDSGVSY